MAAALSVSHNFGILELPSHARKVHAADDNKIYPVRLVSDTLAPPEVIRISMHRSYRLVQDEHKILRSALMDSVKVRTVLRRS